MHAYQGIALRTAYLLAGNVADAEEAAQDAFVKAYRALWRFRAGSPFKPWLLRIVANEARNRRRSAGRRATLVLRAAQEPSGEAAPSPEAALLGAERRDELVAAFRTACPIATARRSLAGICSTSRRRRRPRRSVFAPGRSSRGSRGRSSACVQSWDGGGGMIERELRALAALLDGPAERDLAPAVRARLRGRPNRRAWVVAAFAAALSRSLRRSPFAGAVGDPSPLPSSGGDDRARRRAAAGEAADDARPWDPNRSCRGRAHGPLPAADVGPSRPQPAEVTWDGGLLWYRYGRVRLLVSQGIGAVRGGLVRKVYEPGTPITRRHGRRRAGVLHLRRAAPRLPRAERPVPGRARPARGGRSAVAARAAAGPDRGPVHGRRGAADRAQFPRVVVGLGEI